MQTQTISKNQTALDPRDVLKAELSRRCRKNPRYSLRAFARAVGISHTVLSLVMAGKRPLSKKATRKLAEFLELSPEMKRALIGGSPVSLQEVTYRRLSMDHFEVISDWYHYAILSALELPHAQFEAKWFSKQLGITEIQAQLAMERLERLGLIARDEKGKHKQSGQPIKIENKNSTEATRKFHAQLLDRAIESLENDPIETRNFSSVTFAMAPSQIEYAAERIQKFRRELTRELEQAATAEAVYQLSVQLFPVTPTQKKPLK